MFTIALVDDSSPLPSDVRCQEASILSRETYIPCNAPAVAIVHHDRDGRSYYMCHPCADHNIRNRGGKLVNALEGYEDVGKR